MMKKIFVVLFAMMLMLVLAACGSEGSYETIDIDQIEAKVQDGYKVLDVREPDEYADGHIVGAANKPLSELQASNFERVDKESSYIVICRSGNRSQEASKILVDEGYTVVNVSKGMSSWTGEIEN